MKVTRDKFDIVLKTLYPHSLDYAFKDIDARPKKNVYIRKIIDGKTKEVIGFIWNWRKYFIKDKYLRIYDRLTMSKKQVKDIKIGDRLDLAGDNYADPDNSNTFFECQYVEVTDLENETPNCICIYTEAGAFGMPPDHLVKLPDK